MARPKRRRHVQPKPVMAKFDIAQTTSENRNHWSAADTLSARASLSPAVRRVIRIRSRYEAENNSWYAGILRTAVNHIVGNGPRLQVLTADAQSNARLEHAWAQWSKRIQLADKLRTMTEAYWRDGEVFVMRAERPRSYPLSLDLRIFETEQIASPIIGSILGDQFVDDGIRFDAQTNELEVYVYDHHPGGPVPLSISRGQWYPASMVLHLFRAERPGQVRGLPRATPALQLLPIMRRQQLATLFSAEAAANFAIYLKSNSPAIDPTASPADFAEIEIARNLMTTLPAGWDIAQIEPRQPGPQYEMFQDHTLKSFARCTNMPYPLAAGTAEKSNFSSFKGDMRNVWRPEVVTEQNRIEDQIIEPVFGWFLEAAVFAPGVLDGMPPIADVPHQWHWPPLPDLDPVDTASAGMLRLSSGQTTLTQLHAESGRDWETEANRAASDLGISLSQYKGAVAWKLFGHVPAAVATGATDGAAVADTAMNGAQVSSLLEIVTQASTGAIPPETAKAVIRSAFPALRHEQIESIVNPLGGFSPAIGVDGQPVAPAQGEYTQLGQRAFTNNLKRIRQTLDQVVTGEMSRVFAEQTLASIGLDSARIKALIDDALDGRIDDPQLQEATI
jgi:lambda family phage portal protein